MALERFIDHLVRTRTQRKFYGRIPDSHVLDEGFSPQAFEPEKGYFQIVLSEMFLRDRRQFWQGFVPLSITINDFIYGGSRHTIPFFVDNKLLQGIERYVKEPQVEYYNTKVAGPTPYAGGTVSLFVGLFRIQVDNLAEKLFNFLQTVVSTFDFTVVSTYLDIARALTRGLEDLLDMEQVQFRLGTRDVFTDRPGDTNQFKEGYLVYVNSPENSISADRLWVKDGRLRIGSNKDATQRFTQDDYCLIHIEHLPARTDYTTLPFQKLWKDAKKKIYEGDHILAKAILMELAQQLALSPDLTQDHRYDLIRLYKANFEKEVALYQELHGFRIERIATVSRRGAEGILGPQESIAHSARLAHKAGFPEDIVDGLLELSNNWEQIKGWERIPELKGGDQDIRLTNEILSNQLKGLESISTTENRDPKALADAITFTALNPT
jgi:hypothetical protein